MIKANTENLRIVLEQITIIIVYLFVMGYAQKWWYSFRLWWARNNNHINYDRLRLERKKFEAGVYKDDSQPE